jgi:poly-gamma-glutamate biosynthesis protein PgsC/CapC
MAFEAAFLALLISLAYLALTGLSPGGIIVPSYLVLFLHNPERIAGTAAAALLTLACFKLASRHLILFGRRRFVFMVLGAALWTLAWGRAFPSILPGAMEYRVIGWIIPGLIANSSERQGVLLTGCALVTVTIVAYVAASILGLRA